MYGLFGPGVKHRENCRRWASVILATVHGPVGLVGSGEFTEATEAVDMALIDGRPQRAVIIPAAAGQEGDGSIQRWLKKGINHYTLLGIEPVPLPIADRSDALKPAYVNQIAGAGLIYFSGGDPAYLSETLRGTPTWEAVLEHWRNGGAIAGCSAGAMMMGSQSRSPRRSTLSDSLRLFEHLVVIPHFDRMKRFRGRMVGSILEDVSPGTTVLGIDENTGITLIDDQWVVHGRGSAWELQSDPSRQFKAGSVADLALRPLP